MSKQAVSASLSNLPPADSQERHHWISVASYFKWENRGKLPGYALDDWLEAELDYLSMQVESFLLRCSEDGVMGIEDLRRLAHSMGVDSPERLNQEAELIRGIQSVCRHSPCFRLHQGVICDDVDCEWKAECRKLIAVWYR